ncbi:uncharacterized protein LOC121414891 [Lytechinus variegatus]|uniref:uncharacterized protein LOC121414891 n=1 Tax=Lytechinus variegatus TaxID=7654 RepID=UPI001BB19767|nr:uncharacterized protein LOC121414891 [Lytechinus variegatus]
MATAVIFLIFFVIVFDPVQLTPSHISGPEDVYVFKNNAVNLKCTVGNASGHAVIWQAVDEDGAGSIVGKCFNCPSQERCSVGPGLESEYSAMKQGSTYILTIRRPQVPKTNPFGHFQCGYQKVRNCESDPVTEGRYYLLRSAIVYTYDFPSCASALINHEGDIFHDMTCTWAPRFYIGNEHEVQAELTISDNKVKPDLLLPHGMVKRSRLGNVQESEVSFLNPMCTVILSGKSSRSCNFSLPRESESSVLIMPLIASIKAGHAQEFSCDVQPNSTLERSWEIFQGRETSEKILTSTRSKAGDVTFLSANKHHLRLETRDGDAHYYLECSIETMTGVKVSAFAYVLTHSLEDETTVRPPAVTTVKKSTESVDIMRRTTLPADEPNETPPAIDDNTTGILIFVIVPIVLIIAFFIIGFAVIRNRTQRHSFKQPPRKMEVNYSNMGSKDNIIKVVDDDDGDIEQDVGANAN